MPRNNVTISLPVAASADYERLRQIRDELISSSGAFTPTSEGGALNSNGQPLTAADLSRLAGDLNAGVAAIHANMDTHALLNAMLTPGAWNIRPGPVDRVSYLYCGDQPTNIIISPTGSAEDIAHALNLLAALLRNARIVPDDSVAYTEDEPEAEMALSDEARQAFLFDLREGTPSTNHYRRDGNGVRSRIERSLRNLLGGRYDVFMDFVYGCQMRNLTDPQVEFLYDWLELNTRRTPNVVPMMNDRQHRNVLENVLRLNDSPATRLRSRRDSPTMRTGRFTVPTVTTNAGSSNRASGESAERIDAVIRMLRGGTLSDIHWSNGNVTRSDLAIDLEENCSNRAQYTQFVDAVWPVTNYELELLSDVQLWSVRVFLNMNSPSLSYFADFWPFNVNRMIAQIIDRLHFLEPENPHVDAYIGSPPVSNAGRPTSDESIENVVAMLRDGITAAGGTRWSQSELTSELVMSADVSMARRFTAGVWGNSDIFLSHLNSTQRHALGVFLDLSTAPDSRNRLHTLESIRRVIAFTEAERSAPAPTRFTHTDIDELIMNGEGDGAPIGIINAREFAEAATVPPSIHTLLDGPMTSDDLPRMAQGLVRRLRAGAENPVRSQSRRIEVNSRIEQISRLLRVTCGGTEFFNPFVRYVYGRTALGQISNRRLDALYDFFELGLFVTGDTAMRHDRRREELVEAVLPSIGMPASSTQEESNQ